MTIWKTRARARTLLSLLASAALLAAALAATALPSLALSEHCPEGGVKVEATGGTQQAINDTVLPAGTLFCVKASDEATGILTADGETTLREYAEQFIGDHDVSYFVTYPPTATPTPDATPTPTPDATPTPTPDATPTPTPDATPTPTPDATPTPTPDATPTPTPDATPTPTPDATPTPTPDATPTPTPDATPTPTPDATPTPTPDATPTPTPTEPDTATLPTGQSGPPMGGAGNLVLALIVGTLVAAFLMIRPVSRRQAVRGTTPRR